MSSGVSSRILIVEDEPEIADLARVHAVGRRLEALDVHEADLEDRVALRIEAAGLKVDHDGKVASKPRGHVLGSRHGGTLAQLVIVTVRA